MDGCGNPSGDQSERADGGVLSAAGEPGAAYQECKRKGQTLRYITQRVPEEDRATFQRLSVRSLNALMNWELESAAAVRALWDAEGPNGFLRLPNLGQTSLREIIRVFGLDEAPRRVSEQQYRSALRVASRALQTIQRYREQAG